MPAFGDALGAGQRLGSTGRRSAIRTSTGGGDRIRYRLDLPEPRPYEVEVELRYQTIGYRWAQNLAAYDALEPQRFLSYSRSMPNVSSLVVAAAQSQGEAGRTSAF
jgi:hypothetical protein